MVKFQITHHEWSQYQIEVHKIKVSNLNIYYFYLGKIHKNIIKQDKQSSKGNLIKAISEAINEFLSASVDEP